MITLEDKIEALQHCTELTFMQAYGKLVELKVRSNPSDRINLEQIPEVFHDSLEQFCTKRGSTTDHLSGLVYSLWFDYVYSKGIHYPIQFKVDLHG